MNTDPRPQRGKHDGLTEKIIRVFYEVYNELGYGFLESVYQASMVIALEQAGLNAEPQVDIPVCFRGVLVGTFRADIVVNGLVLVELKAADALVRQHEWQVLHYLRSTMLEVALLMNFGPEARFKRLVLDSMKKRHNAQAPP